MTTLTVVPQFVQVQAVGPDVDVTVTVESAPQITVDVGIPGPPGTPGGAAGSYDHTQIIASAEWVINHNLGRPVDITVLSPGGALVIADVVLISDNQARIYFVSPKTGTALVR